MRVVIVGGGHDGAYLAERLIAEGQDVVLVEIDDIKAAQLQDQLDALVLVGNGASPAVLKEAGVDAAGLFLAVSDHDGANVMACHSAKALGAAWTVARVEDADLREVSPGLGVDVIIDPRESAARDAAALVRYAGVSDLVEFAGGRLMLVGGRVAPDSGAAGRTVSDLRAESPSAAWVLAAVVRHHTTRVGRGHTLILPGDRVLTMVDPSGVADTLDTFGVRYGPPNRVVLLGGTRIAEKTADLLLATGCSVVIVDRERERCTAIARRSRALVLLGDPTRPEVLGRLDLGPGDAVAGMSGFDEVNLMGCLVARSLGAGTTIARFGAASVAGLLQDVGIDATLSSRVAAANAILRFVRRDQILSVATFHDTDAELLEIEIGPGSRAAGRAIRELGLPPQSVVTGIVRGARTVVPRGDTRIEVRDLVLVLSLRRAIDAVETIFLA